MSLSSSISSSSFAKRALGQSFYFCEVEATLRYSNTVRNPGRPFLRCPKYNTEGLPYCKYFKWADSNQYIELDLQERKNEPLRKEKALEKILDNIEKREIELRKKADEIEKRKMVLSSRNEEVLKKELMLLEQQAEIRRSHTLLWVYWAFAVVVSCYLVVVSCYSLV